MVFFFNMKQSYVGNFIINHKTLFFSFQFNFFIIKNINKINNNKNIIKLFFFFAFFTCKRQIKNYVNQ